MNAALNLVRLLEDPNYINDMTNREVKEVIRTMNYRILYDLERDRRADIFSMDNNEILYDIINSERFDEFYEIVEVSKLSDREIADILMYVVDILFRESKKIDFKSDFDLMLNHLYDTGITDLVTKILEGTTNNRFELALINMMEEYNKSDNGPIELYYLMRSLIEENFIAVVDEKYNNFMENIKILEDYAYDLMYYTNESFHDRPKLKEHFKEGVRLFRKSI